MRHLIRQKSPNNSVLSCFILIFAIASSAFASGARTTFRLRDVPEHARVVRDHTIRLMTEHFFYLGRPDLTKVAMVIKMQQMEQLSLETFGKITKELFAEHLIEVVQEVNQIEKLDPGKKVDAETVLFAATILSFLEPLDVTVPKDFVNTLIERPELLNLVLESELVSFRNSIQLKEKLIALLSAPNIVPGLKILDPFVPVLHKSKPTMSPLELIHLIRPLLSPNVGMDFVSVKGDVVQFQTIASQKTIMFPLTLLITERNGETISQQLRAINGFRPETINIKEGADDFQLTEMTFSSVELFRMFIDRAIERKGSHKLNSMPPSVDGGIDNESDIFIMDGYE